MPSHLTQVSLAPVTSHCCCRLRCGWKPPYDLAAQVLHAVEHLTNQRLRDPKELGYMLPGGGHRKVTLSERRRKRSDAWPDGSATGTSDAAKEKRRLHREDVMRRAR